MANNIGIPRMPIASSAGGIPPSQMQPQVEQLSLGERLLIGATPIVTVGSLIGLGYPPYSALLRWRICEPAGPQLVFVLPNNADVSQP